jgi:hypothetical protein
MASHPGIMQLGSHTPKLHLGCDTHAAPRPTAIRPRPSRAGPDEAQVWNGCPSTRGGSPMTARWNPGPCSANRPTTFSRTIGSTPNEKQPTITRTGCQPPKITMARMICRVLRVRPLTPPDLHRQCERCTCNTDQTAAERGWEALSDGRGRLVEDEQPHTTRHQADDLELLMIADGERLDADVEVEVEAMRSTGRRRRRSTPSHARARSRERRGPVAACRVPSFISFEVAKTRSALCATISSTTASMVSAGESARFTRSMTISTDCCQCAGG